MASHVTDKRTPAALLEEKGWKPTDLAAATGLSIGPVRRAVLGGSKRTKIATAKLIAEALGFHYLEIEWPAGLTRTGRPPLTGGSYSASTGTQNGSSEDARSDAFSNEKAATIRSAAPVRALKPQKVQNSFCPKPEHNLLLPLSGVCDLCAA